MAWDNILAIVLGIISLPANIKAWLDWPKVVPRHRLLPLFGIVLAIAAIILAIWEPSAKLQIEITSPTRNAPVAQQTVAEGYLTSELPEGLHLYIVVEWLGRWWPQYGSITPVYSTKSAMWEWSAPVQIGKEGDAGDSFNIVATLVDEPAHRRIQSWLREGEGKAAWTGIPLNEITRWGEVQVYDRVNVLRQ